MKTKPTRRSTSRSSIVGKMQDNAVSFWFLAPILIIFFVLTIIPLTQSLYYSLTNYDGYNPNYQFVGFANYLTIFRDSSLLSAIGFTLLYAFSVTVIVTLLAIPLAVVLNQAMWGRSFARSLFFFLGVPAQAIIGLIWQYIFSPLDSGVINSVLKAIGMDTIQWLSVDGWARFAVIFVAIWMQVGWHATLYLAYLQIIPADLYEQSRVDGANGWHQFIHITLPNLIPGIVVSAFLLMTTALKIYDLPYVLTGGGPGYATRTVTQAIILRGIGQSDYGLGSALSTVFTIGCVLVIIVQMRISNMISRRFD